MPELRPDLSRFFTLATSRINLELQNIQSSIRSFGNRFQNHINRLHQSNSSSPFNSTNPFLDSNDTDPSNQASQITVDNTANSCSNTQRNHQRSRSSNRNRHSSCHDFRNAYHHVYRNGLISVRTLDKDRNVLAAILSIIVIAVLATALAQPKWFLIYNDLCAPRYFTRSDSDKASSDDLPSIFDLKTNQFTQYRPQFYTGPLHLSYPSSYALAPVTIYGLTPDYKNCSNAQILALKRTIIGLCFLAIMCTLVQFFMDTMGTRRKWVNSMRVYAIGNIICVLLCVLVIGLCYFISVMYERVQLQQLFSKVPGSGHPRIKNHMISRSFTTNQLDYLTIHQIEVKFDLSYYLVTLAGFLSILASAANLFRRPRQIFIERISEVNNCRTRHLRTPNGDENSLLRSDVLNNGTDSIIHNQFLPPYSYSPNSWLFNPNWTLYYNSLNPNNPHSYTTNSNNNQITNPANGTNGMPPLPNNNDSLIPNVPQNICPPPPPYSP